SSVKLAGRVSNRAGGVAVTVSARPTGRTQPTRVAVVHTGTGGRWTYTVRPLIATTYTASAGGKSSPSVLIDVRPVIAIHVTPAGAVVARVKPSLNGRFVQLQQLTSRWTTL